jgi:hypothetical protein
MEVKKHSRNVHELLMNGESIKIAMMSDLHWDNPHCDQDLLKKHLDYCKEKNIPVILNGDTFCLMQGRGDNRRNKSDIRPEHNNARYLDSIVETAVDWFTPYADIIKVIHYGNHETGIIKYQETDVLQRFVDLLNYKCSTAVQTGGYSGWVIVKQDIGHGAITTTRIKMHHGSGGGGIVTKGAINLTRALEMYEDFDVFAMGHIHENSARNDIRESITHHSKIGYKTELRPLHLMITGTYKEEYGDANHGWHIERGAPPKPLGGRILTIRAIRTHTDSTRGVQKHVDSTKFNI